MTTEKIAWISLLLCVLGLGWLCSRPEKIIPPIVSEVLDSNIAYDELEAVYQTKTLILYDSIETLNKRLKTVKTIFKYKYKEILIDSLITDSNCLITLFYANETINQQDSIIEIQSRGLESCGLQVENLRNQVLMNRQYSDKLIKITQDITQENAKLSDKLKRNRIFSGIIAGILVSFILLK